MYFDQSRPHGDGSESSLNSADFLALECNRTRLFSDLPSSRRSLPSLILWDVANCVPYVDVDRQRRAARCCSDLTSDPRADSASGLVLGGLERLDAKGEGVGGGSASGHCRPMGSAAAVAAEGSRHFATEDVSQHLVLAFDGYVLGMLRPSESLGVGDPIA